MRPSPRFAVAVLAAGLLALAAGCGGGGKKSSSTPTSPGTTAATGTTTGGTGGSFASAKNCLEFSNLAAKVASAMATTAGKNPATALDTEAKQLQALADAAPAEIRADLQTFAAAFTGFLSALEKAGYKPGQAMTTAPSPAQIAALTRAAKSFDTAKVKQAEEHLGTWASQNCK